MKDVSLAEMRGRVSAIIDDVSSKTKVFLEHGVNNIPIMPEISEIEDINLIYTSYYNHISIQDELIQVKVRLDLVNIQISEILKMGKLSRDLTNDYSELNSFKRYLESSVEVLDRMGDALNDIKRVINTRTSILNSLMFKLQ